MERNSNDDRSDSLNPNNQRYKDSLDNRSEQLDPKNDKYQGSDKETKDSGKNSK